MALPTIVTFSLGFDNTLNIQMKSWSSVLGSTISKLNYKTRAPQKEATAGEVAAVAQLRARKRKEKAFRDKQHLGCHKAVVLYQSFCRGFKTAPVDLYFQ